MIMVKHVYIIFFLFQEYDSSRDLARFYPYGDRKTKERNWRRVNNQNEARVEALASLPDKTQRISGDSIRDLLLESFTSLPSKFPAYIITGMLNDESTK